MNILFLILLQLISLAALAETENNTEIKVYRNPNCNCCHKWMAHLEENKFSAIDVLTNNMADVKEAVKLPKQMASCHTAIIEGYIIEGHVPATDIRRLLASKLDIAGLSVPQMPVGTPGMEMGPRKDNFIVFQFDHEGHYDVFNQYLVDEHNDYQAHPSEGQH